MVNFPNNPVARESVTRYLEVLKSVFERASEGQFANAAVQVAR
jgi:hypothetical protein